MHKTVKNRQDAKIFIKKDEKLITLLLKPKLLLKVVDFGLKTEISTGGDNGYNIYILLDKRAIKNLKRKRNF